MNPHIWNIKWKNILNLKNSSLIQKKIKIKKEIKRKDMNIYNNSKVKIKNFRRKIMNKEKKKKKKIRNRKSQNLKRK